MAIDEFDFIKYNEGLVKHIERHLEGSVVTGSHFKRNAFPDAKALIDCALEYVGDYNGQRTEVVADLGRVIGYDALVRLDDLPSEANVIREPRGIGEYMANVVEGVPKMETTQMVVVAGPLREEGKHGFYTIFPGKNAPPFPVGEEQLKEWGYTGKTLNDALETNKGYEAFWKKHALIKD